MKFVLNGLVLVAVVVGSVVQAESLIIRPRVDIGYSDYTLEEDETIGEVTSGYPLVGVGGNIVFQRLLLDFAYATNFGGEYEDNEGLKEDFERNEWSGALGFRIIAGLSVFGGYRDGASDLTIPDFGQGLGDTTLSFKTQGPFVGAAYSLPLPFLNVGIFEQSAVTFTGALTYQKGKVELDFGDAGTFEGEGDEEMGYSLGAAYSTQIGGGLGAQLRVRYEDFSYADVELDTDVGSTIPFGSFDERIITFMASISWGFGL